MPDGWSSESGAVRHFAIVVHADYRRVSVTGTKAQNRIETKKRNTR